MPTTILSHACILNLTGIGRDQKRAKIGKVEKSSEVGGTYIKAEKPRSNELELPGILPLSLLFLN